MVSTDFGKSGTAVAVGSLASNRPTFLMIGSGSGTDLTTFSGLIAVIGSPKAFTSTDISTSKKITYQGDWTSVEMSGLSLREFILNAGSVDGKAWNYENFGDAVDFDGSTELRIELTWEVF